MASGKHAIEKHWNAGKSPGLLHAHLYVIDAKQSQALKHQQVRLTNQPTPVRRRNNGSPLNAAASGQVLTKFSLPSRRIQLYLSEYGVGPLRTELFYTGAVKPNQLSSPDIASFLEVMVNGSLARMRSFPKTGLVLDVLRESAEATATFIFNPNQSDAAFGGTPIRLIIYHVGHQRVFGMYTYQAFPAIAMANYDFASNAKYYAELKRRHQWVSPRPFIIDLKDCEFVKRQTNAELAMMNNASIHYVFPFLPGMQIMSSDIDFANAVLLGEGANGAVIRAQFRPKQFNLAVAASQTAYKRLYGAHEAQQQVGNLMPTGDIHVVIAMKVTPYSVSKSAYFYQEVRREYSLGLLMQDLPRVTASTNIRTSANEPVGTVTTYSFGPEHLVSCYGWVVKGRYYGLVQRLFPYEFGEKLLLAEQLRIGGRRNVEKNSLLSSAQVTRVFRDTFNALAFMHANKLVHRDVKQANILLDKDYRGFLADFGSIVQMGKPVVANGSTFYAPPAFAVAIQNRTVLVYNDGFCDVYSMGKTMDDANLFDPTYYQQWPQVQLLAERCKANQIDAVGAYHVLRQMLLPLGM
jgi:serine/threonine protein kinase